MSANERPSSSVGFNRRSSLTLLALLTVFLIASHANAFDNQRGGLSVGLGFSYSPVANASSDNVAADEKRAAFGQHISFGYGFNKQYTLVIEGLSIFYDPHRGLGNIISDQKLTSLSLYRYFSQTNRSIFVAGGIGLMSFDHKSFDGDDSGFGARISGGWQFNQHLQAGLFIIAGGTDGKAGKVNHLIVGLIINAIAI